LRSKDLLQKIAERLEFGNEALPGTPVVEIMGSDRVLIENHRGVQQFSTERITVCMRYGLLCVCGNCMELKQMSESKLVIYGQIEQVLLLKGATP